MLNKASQLLVGKHDFESFSKVKTQVNNFNCEVYQAFWKQDDNKIIFHIEANRFLRGMVRAIVGTLLMVNERKIGIDDLKKILKSKSRGMAGQSVSPDGLYLSKVNYPVNIFEL
jgi:tRNA pseudouridine38-40 synthase